MTTRKICSALLAAALVLGLAACGSRGDDSGSRASSGFSSSGSGGSSSSVPSVPEGSQPADPYQNLKPGPLEGAVPESPPVDPSYFDDAVFVGDSVSLKLEYYEAAMNRLGNAQFLTAGSLGSGNALWEVSDESVHPTYNGTKMLLEDSIPLTGARKLYIMLGRNDLAVYGVEGSIENFVTLIGKIKANAPDIAVYVESMTPLSSGSTLRDSSAHSIENGVLYNQRLLETCQQQGWNFVDVASVMYGEDGFLKREYCSDPDNMGMHFTDAGCEAWINYLYTHTA